MGPRSSPNSTHIDLFDQTTHLRNRGLIDGVKTPKDERLAAAFRRSAAGGTPLTQSLRIVAEHCEGERPVNSLAVSLAFAGSWRLLQFVRRCPLLLTSV